MKRAFALIVLSLAAVAAMTGGADAAPKKPPPAKTVDAGVPDAVVAVDDPNKWPQFRLAVMPMTGVNVKPELLNFYTEHFGAAFTANGVKVTTPAQIQAVLGLERQKQLLGCEEGESCLAELGNALGVDGIVNSNIAMLDNTYRLNIKIVSAATGELLSSSAGSKLLKTQTAVADELTVAAKAMSRIAAGRAKRKLGAYIPPTNLPPIPENIQKEAQKEAAAPQPVVDAGTVAVATTDGGTLAQDAPVKTETVPTEQKDSSPKVVEKKGPPPKEPSNTGSKFLMGTGGVIGGLGLLCMAGAIVTALPLWKGDMSLSVRDAKEQRSSAQFLEFLGWSGIAIGAPLFFIGYGSYDSGPQVSAAVTVSSQGGGLVVEGSLP